MNDEKKKVKLQVSVFEKKKKNMLYDLPYKLKYKGPLFKYINECFKIKDLLSVICYQEKGSLGQQIILEDNIYFKDLDAEKFLFYLYLLPNANCKQTFLEFINEQKNPELYFYAVLQANGDKKKAMELIQPKKKNSDFDLNKHVESAQDFHNIYFAYQQYENEYPDKPLSPQQYLVHFKLRKELFNNTNVKQFLDSYESVFKYKNKVYEYYKFQLSPKEFSIVDNILTEYYGIKLDEDDGNVEDSKNEIIQAKEIVLNTYMASNKNEELTRTAIKIWLEKDI